MEPISTQLVTSFLIDLVKKGFDKAIEKSGEKLSEGAINWLKKIFFKDDKPQKPLIEFSQNPESIENKTAINSIIMNSLEDDPHNISFWQELQKINTNPVDNRNAKIGQQNINSIVNNYVQNKEVPKFLTPPNVVIPDFFINIDNELSEIERRLNSANRPLLLINGEGGIGKTTTAHAYWKKNIDKYNHLAYFTGDSDLINSFPNIFHYLKIDIQSVPEGVAPFA